MSRLRRVLFAIIIAVLTSGIVAAISYSLRNGPHDVENLKDGMIVLAATMAFDFLLGFVNAVVFKQSKKSQAGKLSSQAGTRGLMKKSMVIILVALIYLLQEKTHFKEFPFIYTTTLTGFIIMELISIIENLALMGVPMPQKLLDTLEIMKKTTKKEDEDTSIEDKPAKKEQGEDEQDA